MSAVFALMDLRNADLLREFETREAALRALAALADADVTAAEDCGVLEFDDSTGRRIGEPLMHSVV